MERRKGRYFRVGFNTKIKPKDKVEVCCRFFITSTLVQVGVVEKNIGTVRQKNPLPLICDLGIVRCKRKTATEQRIVFREILRNACFVSQCFSFDIKSNE